MFKKSLLAAGAIFMVLGTILMVSGCSSLPDNAAASVNGVIITKDEVADRIRVGAGINPSRTPSDPETDAYKQFQRDMTAQMVSEEVERQEAQKRDLTVTADEVDLILDQVIDDKYLGSPEKLQQDFDMRGVSIDDLRAQISRQILHNKLLESLRTEVPVAEEEVLSQYESSIGNYVYPEKRQVRQVVLADQASAQSIANRLAAGENMPVVAGQSSIDNKTKTNGGLVGLVTQAQLPKAVADVAFSLPVNQVSMPFKGDLGWYVIRVEIVVPASNRTYEQVRDDLMTHMSNQRLSDYYNEFREQVKQEYDVDYASGYEPREADVVAPETTDGSVTTSQSTATTPTP